MSDTNIGNPAQASNEGQATSAGEPNNTSASNEKTFTQDELNAIVTKRLSQLEKKYSNIDIQEYQQLKSLKEQQEQEAALKRQEFDKVLQQVKSASETKISALQKELESIKIDGALIAEASNRRAIAPDKVAALLKQQLRLTQEGSVEVLDGQGQVRFNADRAQPLSVSELVDEFLAQNPFFVAAGPAGTGARAGTGQESTVPKIDITSLDMNNPEHRARYREFRKARGLA